MSRLASSSTILLLGAAGQLGSELSRGLPRLGRVISTTRSGGNGHLPLDLSDADRIRTVVREVRPALIVNAGAYTNVDQAEREPDVVHAVNAVAPGVLQEEAVRLGAAVVHYSTEYVFDGSGSRPWSENDPLNPLQVYGRSKRAGEEAVAAAGGAFLILRTSWLYGTVGDNFVKKVLRAAAQRDVLEIVDDQIGAPTSARFVADASTEMLAAVSNDWAGQLRECGGTFHLCCGGEVSRHRFAGAIVEAARSADRPLRVREIAPVPTSCFPTPARRPLNSRLNCERLRQQYRLTPPDWTEEFKAIGTLIFANVH
jgi:dTDP-4-dehydrorhamnose reductase